MHFPSFIMLISSARQKDKLLLCSQTFFCLNPVLNVYSTTPVEVLLELLLLTRNPSLLVLKIHGKANFLKMLMDVDHDNLRTVLFQTPNISHSYPFSKSRIPLFRRSTQSLKNPSTITPTSFILQIRHSLVVTYAVFG